MKISIYVLTCVAIGISAYSLYIASRNSKYGGDIKQLCSIIKSMDERVDNIKYDINMLTIDIHRINTYIKDNRTDNDAVKDKMINWSIDDTLDDVKGRIRELKAIAGDESE